MQGPSETYGVIQGDIETSKSTGHVLNRLNLGSLDKILDQQFKC